MAERGLVAQAIHRQGRWLSTQFGRTTAGLRMWPDFLIVGAQRAGTTSLYKTLVQHPEVLPAGLHKGVHYFDTDYERGARLVPLRTSRRAAAARTTARRVGRPPITGEASPYYMFHPLVAAADRKRPARRPGSS